MSGQSACISIDIATYSKNCKSFVKNGAGVYECGECDSTKTAATPVTLKASNNQFYKGCAQVSFPNVATYSISSKKDKNGLDILVPLTCTSGSPASATVSVPSYSNDLATQRDDTGVLCRSDYANIKIWEYVNGAYVPAACDTASGYGFVNFDPSSTPVPQTTKGCMPNIASNPKLVSTCSLYS